MSDVELEIEAAIEVVRVGNDRLGWTHWDARNPGTDSCTIKVYLATCPCVACMVDNTSWVSLGAEMDISRHIMCIDIKSLTNNAISLIVYN